MKLLRYWRGATLYMLLAAALAVSAFSFIRTDQYRERSTEILHQAYEVQWRASQIREKAAIVRGYLENAVDTGEVKGRLLPEIDVLAFNIRTLLELNYTPTFFFPRDVARLNAMAKVIEDDLRPGIEAGRYDGALQNALSIHKDALAVSGTAVSHSKSLSDEAIIGAGAEMNRYQFALALTVVAIIFIFVHHRSLIAQREDEHLRSFSALFGHITRSRIAPLRLILNRLGDDATLDQTSVKLAQQSVQELIAANEELVRIAYAGSKPSSHADSRREPLASVLDTIIRAHDSFIHYEADEGALAVLVPASEFHVLIDELIVNAEKAVASRDNPKITIRARVTRDWLLRRRLVLVVSDNGTGMSSAVLANATTLFFSTRGGSHVGLGLSSCPAILKAMGGRLHLESTPDVGTTVSIIYPLK